VDPHLAGMQYRELTEDDLRELQRSSTTSNPARRSHAEEDCLPLQEEQIRMLHRYRLKVSDMPPDSEHARALRLKRRERKRAEKLLEKDSKVICTEDTNPSKQEKSAEETKTPPPKHQDKGSTGLPILDEIINSGFSIAPHDLKKQLERCSSECSLCFEALKPGEIVRLLTRCRHVFH
jgi:hypothetical protein